MRIIKYVLLFISITIVLAHFMNVGTYLLKTCQNMYLSVKIGGFYVESLNSILK